MDKFDNRVQKNGPYYMSGTDIVMSTRHHAGDGRGPRNVYVDGKLARLCIEADTEEGWAIVMREDGVKETLKGSVEVVRAWTGKECGT